MQRTIAILAALALAAASASAQVTVPALYSRDGEIGLSVRNEVDAATARARRWLAATQLESGAWDSTNRCGATAIAALALFDPSGGDAPGETPSRRAAKWLKDIPEDQLAAALPEERAWRDLALGVIMPPAEEAGEGASAGDCDATFGGARPDPFAAFFEACAAASPDGIARRCAEAMGQSSTGDERAALAAAIAEEWRNRGAPQDEALGLARTCFFVACFIGNCADGILSADFDGRSERVPWREDVAALLVARQRVDPKLPGTAYWRGPEAARLSDWSAAPVPETALAVLCLNLL